MIDSRDMTNLAHTISRITQRLQTDAIEERNANRSFSYMQCLAAENHMRELAGLLQDLSRMTDWTQRGPAKDAGPAGDGAAK